jgi:hypothetical protein
MWLFRGFFVYFAKIFKKKVSSMKPNKKWCVLILVALMVVLTGVLASLVLADESSIPHCLMRPDYLEIRLPSRGFTWLPGEDFHGRCDTVPAKEWIRRPSGSLDLFVYADGPSGSGRFWNVTVGVAERQNSKPIRGVCFTTSTLGWRTLQQYKNVPLAWLNDLDKDGSAKLIIWSSFPLREDASMADSGLMAWVYRLASKDSLAIDWGLSRRMAREIAEAYRSPLESTDSYFGLLRIKAAEALERFANEGCSVPQNNTR